MRALLALVLALLVAASGAPPAQAAVTKKKTLWGPVRVDGVSQFPIYRDLGAGIYHTTLPWAGIAPTRPVNPRDPSDPAYRWPAEVDDAVREAARHGIEVAALVASSPRWANGDRPSIWAPRRPADFGDFLVAASRRYPSIRHWVIWNEPSKASRWQPVIKAEGRRLTRRQKHGPRVYARLLDASYAALKGVSRRNLVVGGNTWTGGEVTPLNFIRAMRLPNGRRPRMDLYGHNPFTARRPDLANGPIRYGFADFSDLDTLTRWLDRFGYRRAGTRRRLRLFLSEMVIPTDHSNYEFNFWVDRTTQAQWIRAALRITRRFRRIYTFGYLGLYDDPARPEGDEVNRGLIDREGRKKPSYLAFKRG